MRVFSLEDFLEAENDLRAGHVNRIGEVLEGRIGRFVAVTYHDDNTAKATRHGTEAAAFEELERRLELAQMFAACNACGEGYIGNPGDETTFKGCPTCQNLAAATQAKGTP